MKIILSDYVKKSIPELLRDRKKERVAAIYGSVKAGDVFVSHIVGLENEHENPEWCFAVSNKTMRCVRRMSGKFGAGYLGILHSHPPGSDSSPSPDDIAQCTFFLGGIYHTETGVLVWYNKKGEISREKLKFPLLVKLFDWSKTIIRHLTAATTNP